MMKLQYIKLIPGLLALGVLFLASGCEEEDLGPKKRAQEQRYFDLYMGVTYKDTIAPPTESGLFFIEVTPGTGEIPGEEDWMLVNYVGYVIPEEQVVESYLENVAGDHNLDPNNDAIYGPFKLLNGTRSEGLSEGLSMMREGGEAIMCYTSDLGYGSTGTTTLMKSVKGYKSMKYEVQLLEVIPDMEVYEQARIEAYTDTIIGVDTIHYSAMDTVMYYVVDMPVDTGTTIAVDSVVEIAYKGYLIDGRVFDESEEGSPLEFTVGDESGVIEGWNLGVTRFREGEKGRLIIPYHLAYGEPGRMSNNIVAIPPYENLVFDIEIVSVKSDSDSGDPDPEE
ncbi:MAG: FKBP-type peptidyl-prolyl cis-trans isomerase [Bacteroidota bacterium]